MYTHAAQCTLCARAFGIECASHAVDLVRSVRMKCSAQIPHATRAFRERYQISAIIVLRSLCIVHRYRSSAEHKSEFTHSRSCLLRRRRRRRQKQHTMFINGHGSRCCSCSCICSRSVLLGCLGCCSAGRALLY